MNEKSKAVLWMFTAYVIAVGVGAFTVHYFQEKPPILAIALGDIAATIVIFLFSRSFNNSSFYDPYWSVIPPFLAIGWFWLSDQDSLTVRQIVMFLLILFWAVRLTLNFLRGFKNLQHEDWRYGSLAEKTGKAYWLVSFLGIHFFPTALVFGGSLAIFVVFSDPGPGFGWIDLIGALVTFTAVMIELISDEQLLAFRKANPQGGVTCQVGLWKYSRHPNYFGETMFWWGLYIMSLSYGFTWWVLIGPVAMTLLFQFISIPMIEERMHARRKDYMDYVQRTSAYILWFPKK